MSEEQKQMEAAAIIAALEGVSAILGLINKLAVAARERGEWTPEQVAAFDAKLESVTAAEHWKV